MNLIGKLETRRKAGEGLCTSAYPQGREGVAGAFTLRQLLQMRTTEELEHACAAAQSLLYPWPWVTHPPPGAAHILRLSWPCLPASECFLVSKPSLGLIIPPPVCIQPCLQAVCNLSDRDSVSSLVLVTSFSLRKSRSWRRPNSRHHDTCEQQPYPVRKC